MRDWNSSALAWWFALVSRCTYQLKPAEWLGNYSLTATPPPASCLTAEATWKLTCRNGFRNPVTCKNRTCGSHWCIKDCPVSNQGSDASSLLSREENTGHSPHNRLQVTASKTSSMNYFLRLIIQYLLLNIFPRMYAVDSHTIRHSECLGFRRVPDRKVSMGQIYIICRSNRFSKNLQWSQVKLGDKWSMTMVTNISINELRSPQSFRAIGT